MRKKLELQELHQIDIWEMEELYKTISMTNIAMSWGRNTPTKFNNWVLWFRVQWFLFKGWVLLSVAYDDTFTITLTKTKKYIEKQIKWIYIEDLIETLDRYIEKDCSDKEYEKQVWESAILI